MGLKRRNPARTRLFTAPEMLATLALSRAPAANEPAKTARAKLAETQAAAQAVLAAPSITGEQRHRMIARAAYGRAERAGFAIDPLQSWLAAECEIDAAMARLAS